MSRSRRYFERNDDSSYRGPSDEMLAVDAATEMRSMTLLYERWVDRLYRYFLLSTADPAAAERMLRELIARLPEDLQRFAGQDRSFAGWLFAQASQVFWREYSLASRVSRRVSRYIPARNRGEDETPSGENSFPPVVSGFDEMAAALAEIPADRREVLGVHFGAQLKTASASEALRLPASLMSSHIQWALQSLSEQLGVANNRRLSEDLSELIQHQTLSNQQRQRHFSLINGVFLGEVEVETEESDRAPVFEIGALIGVVIIGLVGIWVWGLITEGDTREHDVASPASETAASDDDAVPTPEPEPTPDVALDDEASDETAEDDAVLATCLPADGKSHFDRFVRLFNDGDFDELEAMIALPEDDRSANDDFEPVMVDDTRFHHDGSALNDPDEILEMLQERHEDGERWDVLQAYPAEHYRNWHGAAPLEMYQDWKRDNPGMSMIIVSGMDWSGNRGAQPLAHGRVVVDCDNEQISAWDIQEHPDQQPASVDAADFLTAMEELNEGQSRSVRARVLTESRPDGGAFNLWIVEWTEAIGANGDVVERADISTLEDERVVSYVNDGNRWMIDQRGWLMYGGADDEIPMPDEINMVVPWLGEIASLLEDFSTDLQDISSVQISEDVSDDEIGARGRQLVLTLTSGNIRSVEILEETMNGEHVRPKIEILSASLSNQLDEDLFEVEAQPRFPELETESPRYEVPEGDHDKLDLISMMVDSDQEEELYRISWNDVEMDLYVRPSRGGLDPHSVPQSIDDSWTNAYAEYDWGTLVWAYRHFAGYPTDAIWDDGRYQFIIAANREDVSADHDWDLDELIELANTLSVDTDDSLSDANSDGGGYGVARVGFTH